MTRLTQTQRVLIAFYHLHAIPVCVWADGMMLAGPETRRWATSRRCRVKRKLTIGRSGSTIRP